PPIEGRTNNSTKKKCRNYSFGKNHRPHEKTFAAIHIGNFHEGVDFRTRRTALKHDIEDRSGRNTAKQLHGDIARRLLPREASCGNETAGHRWIEVRTRNMADRKGHRQD